MSLRIFCSSSDAHSSSTTLDSRPHLASTLTTCSLVGHSKQEQVWDVELYVYWTNTLTHPAFHGRVTLQIAILRVSPSTDSIQRYLVLCLEAVQFWFSLTERITWLKTWCGYIYMTQFIGDVFNTREHLFCNRVRFCFNGHGLRWRLGGRPNTCARRVLPTQNNWLWHYINWIQSRISHFNTPSQ